MKLQEIEEYERKLEEEKKRKPQENIIVDSEVASIFKNRRSKVEKYAIEGERDESVEDLDVELITKDNKVTYILKEQDNYRAPKKESETKQSDVKREQKQLTVVKADSFESKGSNLVKTSDLSKSMPDVTKDLSFSPVTLRSHEGQSQPAHYRRSDGVILPDASSIGKENKRPALRKAKTFGEPSIPG